MIRAGHLVEDGDDHEFAFVRAAICVAMAVSDVGSVKEEKMMAALCCRSKRHDVAHSSLQEFRAKIQLAFHHNLVTINMAFISMGG